LSWLGIGSNGCFAVAAIASLLAVASSIEQFVRGAEAVPGATGRIALLMTVLHLSGMIGTALGFAGRHRSRSARLGLWLNSVLLVVFWVGVALWPM
jgi:hypothetical protein